jgi:transposase
MYQDVAQWVGIRRRILKEGISRRQICRDTGIHRKTIRKILANPLPLAYGPRAKRYPKLGPHLASIRRLLKENTVLPPWARLSVRAIYESIRDGEAFLGDHRAVRNFVRATPHADNFSWDWAYELLISLDKKGVIDFLSLLSRADPPVISLARTKLFFRLASRMDGRTPKPDKLAAVQRDAFEWMRAVLQKDLDETAICQEMADLPNVKELIRQLYNGKLSERNKSMVVLANRHGLSGRTICRFLSISKRTCSKYLKTFERQGADGLFARSTRSNRKFDSEEVKEAVFRTLHEPPSQYGINRTTWIMRDLTRVLREVGHPVCPEVIRNITKSAGYRWRKARIVLTSSDPDYVEKLARIRSILSALGPDEAFFSIDEFGPFAVKMKPGCILCAPGEQRIVPQWQKSRGCIIMTAAIELSGNQVTHFYSAKKNTDEMIRMMELLIAKYADRRKLYLSWDAASWHISKRLNERIERHNAIAINGGSPVIETASLPAGAQFLNVIESVFSGMSRAIINCSDYKSVDAAKASINRHFEDRNAQFLKHPQRAGKRIWGKEREPAIFSDANNCKDPHYR